MRMLTTRSYAKPAWMAEREQRARYLALAMKSAVPGEAPADTIQRATRLRAWVEEPGPEDDA